MQQIQIARGLLQKRLESAPLAFGELFFDTTLENKRNIYIGLKDGSYTRIGGEKSLHFRGEWNSASLPSENVVIGDVYKLLQDINTETPADGTKDFPEYYKGDLIIAAGYEKDAEGNNTENIFWVKVASNGGNADNVKFNNEYTNFVVDDKGNICIVQDALVYIDRNKLSYGGELIVLVEETDEASAETHTKDEIISSALATLQEENAHINNPAGFYFAVPRDMLIDGVQYYENDFVVITSSDYDNETSNPTTYKLQRMPGGAHTADKIIVDSSSFVREEAAEKEYNDDDSAIDNVQDALEQLFNTKADLDRNGKIILNQIPDTIIGSIDYQGIVKSDGNKITLSKYLDVNNEENFEDDKYIQKGDYWVYQGGKLPLGGATLVDPNGAPIAVNPKVNNGDEAYINSGDWLIASENEKGEIVLDILDNTAPFVGITCGDNEGVVKGQDTLDGTVSFTGNVREGTKLKEATATKNETGNGVLISSPNAALIEDIKNAAAFKDYILKVNEYGVLVKGHIKDIDNGIQLEGYKVINADGTSSVVKQQIVVNEQASKTEETVITLPKTSGTLVTDAEVGLADGKDNFNVMFNFDEKTGQVKFTESPLEMHNPLFDENGNKVIPVTAEGFVFHRNPDSATQVLFRPDEANKEHGNTVQVMPPLSGVLLNTNSIIDCGYWGDDGLEVYENEPNKLEVNKLPTQFNTVGSYEDHLIKLAGGSDYKQYSVTFNDTLYNKVSSRKVRENGYTYLPQYESNNLYTFIGWADESGNQYPVENKGTLSPEITTDTVFTAVWSANKVAVILKDIDDTTLTMSSNGENAIFTRDYNSTFDDVITQTIAADDNYKVTGWTRSKEGATNGYVRVTNEDGTTSKVKPNTEDYLLNNYSDSDYYNITELGSEAKIGYNIYRLRNPLVKIDAYKTTEDNERVFQETVFNDYVERGFVDTALTDAVKTFIDNNIDYGNIGEGFNFYIEDAEGNETIITDIFNTTFAEPTNIIALYEKNVDDKHTNVYELGVDNSTITYELRPHYTKDNWKQELFYDLGLNNLYDVNKLDLITFDYVEDNENPAAYLNRPSDYDDPIVIGITVQEDIEAHLEYN